MDNIKQIILNNYRNIVLALSILLLIVILINILYLYLNKGIVKDIWFLLNTLGK
jgi:hypothetical protein